MTETDKAPLLEQVLGDIAELCAAPIPDDGTKVRAIGQSASEALAGRFPEPPQPLGDGAQCGRCGAGIIWIRTKKGALMPCDPKRHVITCEDGVSVSGFVSHFASCPKARRAKSG